MQAAWALVVPPFRGQDEHEHAYKAAAVARGDWSAHHEQSPLDSAGEFVEVPRELVEAATPECESLPYTTSDNCRPVARTPSGMVKVASSAARYNPVFYFVVGTSSRALDGTAELYAMRATGALLCAVFIALAAMAVRRWARTDWPWVAFLLTTTPTMLYTTSVAAPNGVEVSAALLVWSALLGLVARWPERRWFVGMAMIGAIPLVTVRTLGPLWLLLIVVTVGALLGVSRVRRLLQDRVALICAGVVSATTVAAVTWTLAAATNAPPPPAPGAVAAPSVWSVLPTEMVVWVLQSVGAFPSRHDSAPVVVYAMVICAWWVLTAHALRAGRRSERLTLLFVVSISALVPVAATVATYESVGTVWQGRYAWPFTLGFLMICGLMLDRSRSRAPRWFAWATAAAVIAASAISQLGVLADERVRSPLAGTDAWSMPSPLTVVILQVLACLVLGHALRMDKDPSFDVEATGTLRP